MRGTLSGVCFIGVKPGGSDTVPLPFYLGELSLWDSTKKEEM